MSKKRDLANLETLQTPVSTAKTARSIDRVQEVLNGVLSLTGIRAKVDETLRRVAESTEISERARILEECFAQVNAALKVGEDLQVSYASPWEVASLSGAEYFVPEELVEFHQQLLKHFEAGETLERWRYRGVLLIGKPGSGKTEYVRFLMSELADKADFQVANISKIVNAVQPGQALQDMYTDLQVRAVAKNRLVILLFDEFETMVRAVVSKHSSSKESNSRHGEHGTSHSVSSKKVYEVSQRGEELLATFKTMISGTGNTPNVVTICTSNVPEFDEALIREGRLKKIKMRSLALGSVDHDEIRPDVDSASKMIRNVANIWLAACNRRNNGKSKILAALVKAVDSLLKDFEKKKADLARRIRSQPENNGFFGEAMVPQKVADQSRMVWFECLMHFAELSHLMEKRSSLRFDFDFLGDLSFVSNRKELAKVRSRADAAGFLIQNEEQFTDLTAAKRLLAEFIFPQLKDAKLLNRD